MRRLTVFALVILGLTPILTEASGGLWLAFGASASAASVSTIVEAAEFEDDLVKIRNQAPTNFEPCKNVRAISGDIIEFKREQYSHYGVYTGDGNVIHFYQPHGSKVYKHERQMMVNIAGQDMCRVNNLEESAKKRGLTALHPDDILQRVYTMLNKEGKYDLLNNNCETFATQCRYGVGFSEQGSALDDKPILRTAAKFVGGSSKE